jgi:ABC-type amino acid transport substrate-binding protein
MPSLSAQDHAADIGFPRAGDPLAHRIGILEPALADKLNAVISVLAKGGKFDEISAKNGLTGQIITPNE